MPGSEEYVLGRVRELILYSLQGLGRPYRKKLQVLKAIGLRDKLHVDLERQA